MIHQKSDGIWYRFYVKKISDFHCSEDEHEWKEKSWRRPFSSIFRRFKQKSQLVAFKAATTDCLENFTRDTARRALSFGTIRDFVPRKKFIVVDRNFISQSVANVHHLGWSCREMNRLIQLKFLHMSTPKRILQSSVPSRYRLRLVHTLDNHQLHTVNHLILMYLLHRVNYRRKISTWIMKFWTFFHERRWLVRADECVEKYETDSFKKKGFIKKIFYGNDEYAMFHEEPIRNISMV